MLAAYEAAWARLQTDAPGGPSEELDASFHAAIAAWLRYHRAILIGEVIPLTLGFIRNNPAVEAVPRFGHVLVDEYQDLNKAEQELADHLAREGHLTVIGDDCQSIYSFRHANPEGIRTFHTEREGCVSHSIEECRRCPPNIVQMSNALISHEPQRSRDVPLLADATRPNAHVVVVQHHTLADEVEALADYVAHYLGTHGDLAPGQVLVLTPRRFIGNRIRDVIIARGLNSMSYFAEDPVSSEPAAEGFALLSVLVDPADRPALRAWLGMGSQNGRAPAYARVRAEAERTRLSPRDILERLADGRVALPHTGGLLQRWRELTSRLAAIADLRGLELVRAIWPSDDESSDDVRLMAEMIAVATEEPSEILEALRQDITQPYLPDSSSDVIRVMSLHKSKGLTAALVVVAGCMAGALPRIDPEAQPAEQDAQLREQRRLFYVAITRATDTLVLSSPVLLPFAAAMQAQVTIARRRRVGNRQLAETSMSPFVQELGQACPRPVGTQTWRLSDGF
jgi:DNA helicase II / ATP-dependent DNA helicase PcrA